MPRSPWSIGLIGLSYPEWTPTLYAGDTRLQGGRRLRMYAAHFNAVEINTTFYGVPTISAVRTWADATPAEFRVCLKMPREVTHALRPQKSLKGSNGPPPGHLLREETIATARRFLRTIEPLGGKLGAVLVQFPPKFTAERRDELAGFLDRINSTAPIAVELRHQSWWNVETEGLLRDRAACWVGTDESPRLEAERAPDPSGLNTHAPRELTPTADFLYIRWIGKHDQFEDRTKEHFDPSARLLWWTERLRGILHRHPHIRHVYGFFDNDFAGHAPATARRFMDIIGLPRPRPISPATDQPSLFG